MASLHLARRRRRAFFWRRTVSRSPNDLAHRLGRQAEAVCRNYLSNGRRQGNYWLVGDVRNTPGRSMYVRLRDTPKGPAGKWTDAATGEHGDLLDVIRESCGLTDFADISVEACNFLSLPRSERQPTASKQTRAMAPSGSAEAARRLVLSRGRFYGRSLRRTCAAAALRLCMKRDVYASTRIATTVPKIAGRLRSGRR